MLPFQGYLTHSDGTTLPDGQRLVRFAIYDAPNSGRAVWPGEVHQLSVHAGLVNTILGSRVSLEKIDFSRPLYLEITVDGQTSGQVGHGTIGAEDPPLLPRQVLIPVPAAIRAYELGYRDSGGLVKGAGWEEVFDGGIPGAGRIGGEKLRDGSIAVEKLAGGITADQLAAGAALGNLLPGVISGELIAPNAVGSSHIAPEVINSGHLVAGAIDQSRLAPRPFAAQVNAGGVAISEPIEYFNSGQIGPNEERAVPGLAITLPATGRLIRIGLLVAPSGSGGTVAVGGGGYVEAHILFYEGDQLIGRFVSATSGGSISLPASGYSTLYLPSEAGKKEYSVRVQLKSGTAVEFGAGVRLVAYEL